MVSLMQERVCWFRMQTLQKVNEQASDRVPWNLYTNYTENTHEETTRSVMHGPTSRHPYFCFLSLLPSSHSSVFMHTWPYFIPVYSTTQSPHLPHTPHIYTSFHTPPYPHLCPAYSLNPTFTYHIHYQHLSLCPYPQLHIPFYSSPYTLNPLSSTHSFQTHAAPIIIHSIHAFSSPFSKDFILQYPLSPLSNSYFKPTIFMSNISDLPFGHPWCSSTHHHVPHFRPIFWLPSCDEVHNYLIQGDDP